MYCPEMLRTMSVALDLIERSEQTTGMAVEETIGDGAYGDGATRQAFADAGRTLIAKVLGRPNKKQNHGPAEAGWIRGAGAVVPGQRRGGPHEEEPSIQQLAEAGSVQLSLFDTQDLAEVTDPRYPGERLVVCHNPLLADKRARKREDMLVATEWELAKVAAMVE